MGIISFKEFIRESEENELISQEDRDQLNDILHDMEDEEVNILGNLLYSYFDDFDDEDTEDIDDEEWDDDDFEFGVEDIWEIIDAIGADAISVVDAILASDIEEIDDLFAHIDAILDDELSEAVARRMKTTKMNRKRKYMKLTKAKLRAGKAKRKSALRKTRQKRKSYYRRNKRKIASYQASRKKAIDRGKHQVKRRR